MTPEVLRVVEALMADLDCPRSLTVIMMVRHGEWDQLSALRLEPVHYVSSDECWRAAMATELLRKCADIPTTLDLEAVTFSKWLACERKCFETNRRLSQYSSDWGPLVGDPHIERVSAILSEVRKNIEWLIGSSPPTTYDGSFGPGATVSDKSGYTTVPDKMSTRPTLTPGALFHLVPWTGTLWASASADLGMTPLVVRGNMYFTVPKDSTTHRPCAKEPSLSAFYQRGLGLVMAERLRERGIDLRDGQRVHKLIACRASLSHDAATIDLSSASDTIARDLVSLVFPRRWASALESLRSPFTFVNGRWHMLEKFSSMGNGYTFELETVLFTAISMAASNLVPSAQKGKTLLVFGDDIIVNSDKCQDVLDLLKFFGFEPNLRKTFASGEFRESCGGDYFAGVSVRAHYVEGLPTAPNQFISFANGLRRACTSGGCVMPLRWARVSRAWRRLLDCVPTQARNFGPTQLGDLVIHNDDEQRWIVRSRDGIRRVKCWAPVRYRKVMWWGFGYSVQLAASLRVSFPGSDRVGEAPSEMERYLIPRDGVEGFGIKWVPFS